MPTRKNGDYITDTYGDLICQNENLENEIIYGNDKSQEFDLFNKKNDVRVLYLFPSNGISKISQSNTKEKITNDITEEINDALKTSLLKNLNNGVFLKTLGVVFFFSFCLVFLEYLFQKIFPIFFSILKGFLMVFSGIFGIFSILLMTFVFL